MHRLLTGPFFGFSDTWQLVINTGTTIITFLIVFLIQHAQNKDSKALHLKLNELTTQKENWSRRSKPFTRSRICTKLLGKNWLKFKISIASRKAERFLNKTGLPGLEDALGI